jgi:ubiquinone/menaquinone biosynthesis C-methylase UbiE
MDYGKTYDAYWQRSDREGERSGDLKKVAEWITATCGMGMTLDVGSGEGFLVGELLRLGIDAYGLDVSDVVVARSNERWPGRFRTGSILSLPYDDETFQTVVSTDCMEHLVPEDVPAALREMYRVSSRFVLLQIATTQDRDKHWHLTVEGRAWWETRCFEADFRKHPSYYRVNAYEALNKDDWQIFVLLEKIPSAAINRYPISALDEHRLLHMDMLRETGRRGDAHCIRYYMAAQYIRPGDTVLDVACGLGYGSHMLYQNSLAKSVLGVDNSHNAVAYAEANYGLDQIVQFRVGDAQDLRVLPDNSVDFITGFETIEHVPDPKKYLAELQRVLRPSGRLMICAPNDWTDETGKDPNPHHLHVYTWKRLIEECRDLFLLEKGFSQVAGGAMKCADSPRKWTEVSLRSIPDSESEWAVLLCMKDPLGGKGIPYEETSWRIPDSPDFNVAAFGRDYENPWLVRGMVAIGMRSQSVDSLRAIQERVLKVASPDSVDFGAALCGLVYVFLAEGRISNTEYEFLLARINEYTAISNPTPHQLRWQVSLLFAGAELAMMSGRIKEAEKLYTDCADKDVVPYSPLLGNKTLDALFWLAKTALGRHDLSRARRYLLKSVEEAKRLTSGSWTNIHGSREYPLPFGLAELAQLIDKASRAAYMLASLDGYARRPAVLFSEMKGYYERLISMKDHDLSNLRKGAQELAREVARQDANAQELAREVIRQDAHAQELAREVRQQIDRNKSLEDQLRARTPFIRRFVEKFLKK